MFLVLWHYLCGYVIIKITGFSVERFINLASVKGVHLWDIQPSTTGITLKVAVGDFKELKDCARRTRCKISILEKKGIPFKVAAYKKRRLYTVGIFAFVVTLYIMSSFIWNVTISGNERISTEEIVAFCHEEGLYVGQLRFKTDNKSLTHKLVSNFKDISWVAITTKGTDVTISIVETLLKVTIEDRDEEINIVSDAQCIIESISVSLGTARVSQGDVVNIGDILIASEVSLMDGELEVGKKYVHAKGEIKGKSFIIKENIVLLKFMDKQYSGEEKTDKILIIGKYVINVISPNFEGSWELAGTEEKIFKIKGAILPFKIVTERFLRYNEVEKEITQEEAKAIANDAIYEQKQELEFNNMEILYVNTEFYVEEDTMKSKTVFTVIRHIGIEEQIDRQKEGEQLTNE